MVVFDFVFVKQGLLVQTGLGLTMWSRPSWPLASYPHTSASEVLVFRSDSGSASVVYCLSSWDNDPKALGWPLAAASRLSLFPLTWVKSFSERLVSLGYGLPNSPPSRPIWPSRQFLRWPFVQVLWTDKHLITSRVDTRGTGFKQNG